MSHPLDGAFGRVRRADEHLGNLKGEVDAFLASKNRLVLRARVLGVSAKSPLDELPGTFSMLIGEIVYNLRGALDELVYALAERDSEQPQVGTQFPIEDHHNTFYRRRLILLKGLWAAHVEQIEILQPYKGCEWTRLLRVLSDRDKQRHLFVVRNSGSPTLPAVYIAFDDKSPVIPTLEWLGSEVFRTLDAFKADFEPGAEGGRVS